MPPHRTATQCFQSAEASRQALALTGLAEYSPGPAIDNATLEEVLQAPVLSLMSYFGVETRHYAVDPRTGAAWEPDLDTKGMSARAGRMAIHQAGLEPAAIDTLICATSTPDERLPPLPYSVQSDLGIKDLQMYDLRGGCAVAMQALVLAEALITSGRARRVLVTLADTLSRYFLGPLLGVQCPKTEALVNALTFSDGAAAAVIEAESEGNGAYKLSRITARSRFADRARGFEVNGDGVTAHNHRAIRDHLPSVMKEAVQTLKASNHEEARGPIGHLIVPQVNRSLLKLVQSELHDRVYYVGHRIGNCPAPAILRALALGQREGVFTPGGARVGLIGVETASWTYGTALLR